MSVQSIALKLKDVSGKSFARTAGAIGMIAAVGGPFAMVAFGASEAGNLPWYIWTIFGLLLLLVIGAGYYMSLLTTDNEEMSIRPKNR